MREKKGGVGNITKGLRRKKRRWGNPGGYSWNLAWSKEGEPLTKKGGFKYLN